MKDVKRLTERRKQRFMLRFQRYLEKYLNHPGFRNRDMRSGERS